MANPLFVLAAIALTCSAGANSKNIAPTASTLLSKPVGDGLAFCVPPPPARSVHTTLVFCAPRPPHGPIVIA
jgi:hypothetical protein